MKKTLKLFLIILVASIILPFSIVNATTTRTEEVVEALKESVKSFDGTVNYENDCIEIEWSTQNSKFTEISFPYNGSVIEYNPGEIKNYEEAEKASSHYVYAIYLIKSALRVNGYTDEQIQKFLSSETNEFNYDINGIEIKKMGEAKQFTSSDGYSSITVSSLRIRIDVTKANLNESTDAPIAPKTTTISDIIDDLQSNSDFTTTEYEGKVVSKNEIYDNDDAIIICNTYYWDEYHNVLFNCENDILTYMDEEIEDFDDAERASSHHMFASQIITIALKENGYTNEQIQEYSSSEENKIDYDLNGIEFKNIGDSKKYTNDDGSYSITVSPMSIKADLVKANLKTAYEFIKDGNQLYTIEDDGIATFRIDANFSLFENGGAVYVDGTETKDFTAYSGSTIIKLSNNLMSSLSEGEHTLKVTFNNGKSAETKFIVAKSGETEGNSTNTETKTDTTSTISNNPKTGDNIEICISLILISMLGMLGVVKFVNKTK